MFLRTSAIALTTVLAFSAVASAADPIRPVPAPVIPSASVDWNGFYAGVNAGYGFGVGYDSTRAVMAGAGGAADQVNGLFGGVQVGANFQNGAMVLGVETDIQLSGMSQEQGGSSVGVDYFGTLRGRVGVDAGNGILPYVTAGLAYGQGRFDIGAPITRMHVGWTAGAGVEFKLDDQISVKGEYLYTDLGTREYFGAGPGGEAGYRFHAVRAGVNFHF